MNVQRIMRGVAASTAVALALGASGVTVRAGSDKPETLIYAVYNGQDTASNVFKTMKSGQRDAGERDQCAKADECCDADSQRPPLGDLRRRGGDKKCICPSR